MTRDELERCARYLKQGLTLDRETQQRLVDYALGTKPRQHADGCGWWRGSGCTCAEDSKPLDLSVKSALVVGPNLRDYWEHRCDTDDRLHAVPKGQSCFRCGERQAAPS